MSRLFCNILLHLFTNLYNQKNTKMSKVNVTLKESAIQYGLILGGILAILIVMMYALNQDLFLEWWIGIVVIPLIIIGTGIVSTAKSKDLLGGIMTFKEAFTAYSASIIPIGGL